VSYLTNQKRKSGRRLEAPIETFAAILTAKITGLSVRRSTELIKENPNAASPFSWRLASLAASSGIKTSFAFEQWIKELKESL
jgi:hypothetical protein